MLFGGKERIEYPIHDVVGDTMAGVLNHDLEIGLGVHFREARLLDLFCRCFPKDDRQLAAPHGMPGIGAEVHEHLVHLGGIPHDKGIGLDIHTDINGGRQRGPQQFRGLPNNAVQLDRLHFVFALSTEGQDLLDQVFGTQAGLEHLLHVVAEVALRRDIFHGHFGKSDHSGKNIVEIVGDASGQGADGFHFLGLAQLSTQGFPLFFGFDALRQVIYRYEYLLPAFLVTGWDGRFDQQIAIVALEGPIDAFDFKAALLGHGDQLLLQHVLGGLG